jgi:hypothetical protein
MSSTESSALLVRALEALAEDELVDLSEGQTRDRLLVLLNALRLLRAEVVRQVDAFDARGLSVDDGCRSTRSWLRSFGRLSETTAGELVRGARVLRDLPGLAKASAEGVLSDEHLRHVTRLVRRLGTGPVLRAEPLLVEAAAKLDPTDFGRVCERIVAHLDPDGEAPDADEIFARRELVLSPCGGMVLVHGRLDPEGGAALMTALDALMPAPADGDVRSARQRRADALVELARGALTGGRLPTAGGVRPQVGVLVTPQQLMGRQAIGQPQPAGQSPMERSPAGQSLAGQSPAGQSPVERSPVGRSPGRDASVPDVQLDAPGPWLQWVGEVPARVAQRIACDADVWRVVLDPATGRPTEVGRAHRLVPVWIRKALHARDRGCRFPGCRAPAPWTDAHHIRPWARGGPTDVDNLILLCRFHHGLVHEGRWTIRLDPGTGEVAAGRPDGRPYEIRDHRDTMAGGHAA